MFLRLSLIIVGALWSLAYFGMNAIGWGEPGTPQYGRYEMYNRALGILLLFFCVTLFRLHAATFDSFSTRGGRGLLAAALGAAVMAVGGAVEFWLFTLAPYAPGSVRGFGWTTYCVGLLVFYIGGAFLGRDLVASRRARVAGWLLMLAWLPVTLSVAGLGKLTGAELPALSIGTFVSGLAYLLLGCSLPALLKPKDDETPREHLTRRC